MSSIKSRGRNNHLLGITGVCDVLRVHRDTLSEWRRAGRFPEPDVQLAGSPAWRKATVLRWARSQSRAAA